MGASLSRKEKLEIFDNEFFPLIDSLYTFAFHLTYNEDDANDLVQETYLKAFKNVEKYISGTNAKAWLFKILKNGFINNYRKKSNRVKKIDFDEIVKYQDEENNSKPLYSDLREEMFQNIMEDEVTLAINSLNIDSRTVILLCDVEGFTYEEIAKIIDIPIGTVRSRLHRARKALKSKLRSYGEKKGYGKKKKSVLKPQLL